MEEQRNDAFRIRKKKNNSLVLPIVALAVLIVLCVGATVMLIKRTDPEKIVINAINENYRAFMSESRVANEVFGEDFSDMFFRGKYSANGTAQMVSNSLFDKLNGMSVDFDISMDTEKEEALINVKGGVGGVGIIGGQVYSNADMTTFYVPEIFKESFGIENKNIVSQLSKLPVIGAKFKVLPDFDFNIFLLQETADNAYALKDEIKGILGSVKDGLLSKLKYEKGGNVKAPDGNEYQSYNMIIAGKDAVDTAADIAGKLNESAVFGAFTDKFIDSAFSFVNGDKEQFKSKFKEGLAGSEEFLRGVDTDNIVIAVTPVEKGIIFGIDQNVGDMYIKLDGDYDQTSGTLKFALILKGEEGELELNYSDKCAAANGVTEESRLLEVKTGESDVNVSVDAKYNKADGSLTATTVMSDGKDGFSASLEGKTEKTDGRVKVTADKMTVGNGICEAEMKGELSIGELTGEILPTGASETVQIKDIDFAKALELAGELSAKKDSIKKIIEMLR